MHRNQQNTEIKMSDSVFKDQDPIVEVHDDEAKIKDQQKIAKLLLRVFEDMDVPAVLAGGAPRDWYLGSPAKDLDFYVKLTTDKIVNFEVTFLQHLINQNAMFVYTDMVSFSPINLLWVKGITKSAIPPNMSLSDILAKVEEIRKSLPASSPSPQPQEAPITTQIPSPFSFRTNGLMNIEQKIEQSFEEVYCSHIERTDLIAALYIRINGVECQIMISNSPCTNAHDLMRNTLKFFDCSICCTGITKRQDQYIHTVFEEFHQSILDKQLHTLNFVNFTDMYSTSANHVRKIRGKKFFKRYDMVSLVDHSEWELTNFVEFPF